MSAWVLRVIPPDGEAWTMESVTFVGEALKQVGHALREVFRVAGDPRVRSSHAAECAP